MKTTPKKTLMDRFTGPEGQRHRVEAISRQQIVQGDAAIADELNAVAELQQFEKDAPRNVCIEQDSGENDIYLILAGRVSVTVHGREVAVREAGQHVGEMALLEPSKRRCATVTALEETVTARISEANFTPVANRLPTLWRNMALELADRLRQRNKFVTIPNPRPVLFIGSSGEHRHIAREIRDGILADKGILAQVWDDDLFLPSATFIESLERQLKDADFAAMVVTPDDVVKSRGKQKKSPRDNVIWEHGLFLGGLGRQRVYIAKPRGAELKLPTDLLGVTHLEYDPDGTPEDLRSRLGPVINGIRKAVQRLGPK